MLNSSPLVSIIVPIYNKEQFVNRCVDSIVNQTYTNIEVLLIDDGSTDSSKEICDNYALKDKRVMVIHQENGGVNNARYQGVQTANGDWGMFVDADDEIPTNAIESLISESGNYDIVSGAVCIHNQHGNITSPPPQINEIGNFTNKEYVTALLVGSRHCSLWRQLIKMSVLKKHFILLPRDITIAEDFLLNVNIGLNINLIKGIADMVYHYYIYSTGAFKSKNTDVAYEEKLDKHLSQILSGTTEYDEALFRHRMGIIYWYITFEGITRSAVAKKALSVSSKYQKSTNEKLLLFLCKINNAFIRRMIWNIYNHSKGILISLKKLSKKGNG